MCGIVAALDHKDSGRDTAASLAVMSKTQGHRGPDGHGEWLADLGSATLGLGHQRLSILDLSDRAGQPFHSPDGRYVLVFNGEIYNYLELAVELRQHPGARQMLEGAPGDTAVLMAAISTYGVTSALSRLRGMWAFVLWDAETRLLTLSRDRLGIKPLYYARGENCFHAASEMKAVLAGAGGRRKINADEAGRYLLFGHAASTSNSLFDGVHCIPPGHCGEVDLSGDWSRSEIRLTQYWRHPFERNAPAAEVGAGDVREAFSDAVQVHLRSDVPVGVTLSGGIDSSAIAAAAFATAPSSPLTMLSVISDDAADSEEPYIDIMLKALPDANAIKVRIDDNLENLEADIRRLTWNSDQPLKSIASVGLARLCAIARENGIIVLLTGQGADEQLGGYRKYLYFQLAALVREKRVLSAIKEAAQSFANGALNDFKLSDAKRYFSPLMRYTSASLIRSPTPGLAERGRDRSYAAFEYRDMRYYSIQTLLHDEDRMSMSASTEMRVPFLDHHLVELLYSVRPDQKIRGGWTKRIFRDAVAPLLPPAITWRKDKKGFTLPQGRIMRTSLKGAITEAFAPGSMGERCGLFDGDKLRAAFSEFCDGKGMWSARELFRFYAFEVWMQVYGDYIET